MYNAHYQSKTVSVFRLCFSEQKFRQNYADMQRQLQKQKLTFNNTNSIEAILAFKETALAEKEGNVTK